mmetsp:Transcript_17904/g.49654  ORF Transcript_17904/g.49654 Transcript_17904/m.49654 type:complete len:203 (-) Transcript_17904:453-1061(-)
MARRHHRTSRSIRTILIVDDAVRRDPGTLPRCLSQRLPRAAIRQPDHLPAVEHIARVSGADHGLVGPRTVRTGRLPDRLALHRVGSHPGGQDGRCAASIRTQDHGRHRHLHVPILAQRNPLLFWRIRPHHNPQRDVGYRGRGILAIGQHAQRIRDERRDGAGRAADRGGIDHAAAAVPLHGCRRDGVLSAVDPPRLLPGRSR